MKIRDILATTALASFAAFAAVPASAGPLNFSGYSGPIQIKFNNYESFTGGSITTNAQNFGVLSVTSILGQSSPGSGFDTTLWSSGGANGYLAGIFSGITVTSVSGTGPGTFATQNSGGLIDLYSLTTNFSAAQGTLGYAAVGGGCTINQQCYNGISNVGAPLVLSAEFVPGIDPTSSTTTLLSSFTLGTFPFTGSASGYLDVTGGSLMGTIVPGTITTAFGPADLALADNFCVPGKSSGCTQVGDWIF